MKKWFYSTLLKMQTTDWDIKKYIYGKSICIDLLTGIFWELQHNTPCLSDDLPGQKYLLQAKGFNLLPILNREDFSYHKKYSDLIVQEFTVPYLTNSPFFLSIIMQFIPVQIWVFLGREAILDLMVFSHISLRQIALQRSSCSINICGVSTWRLRHISEDADPYFFSILLFCLFPVSRMWWKLPKISCLHKIFSP